MSEKTVPTLFEWIGGMPVVERLFGVFYSKVPSDPVLAPVFAKMSPFGERGATISRLFERNLPEGWITCLSVQSQTAFPNETDARAWWRSLMDRLQRDLPHQKPVRDRSS